MRKAIYAGSFDPITLGHLHILEKASRLFDHVTVLVAVNTDKKYTFYMNDRVQMCIDAIEEAGLTSPRIDVQSLNHDELTVSKAASLNADYLIRGIRTISDFQAEKSLSLTNKKLNSSIETVFILADPGSEGISSSEVKRMAACPLIFNKIEKMITHNVANCLAKHRVIEIMHSQGVDLTAHQEIEWRYNIAPYHNWIHILRMIELIYHRNPGLANITLSHLVKAALVHDQVENTDYLLELCNKFSWRIHDVLCYIEATNHPVKNKNLSDGEKLIHDADLEVLSWEPHYYDRYCKRVRQEHSQINDKDWREGRIKFLKNMLKCKCIYYLSSFKEYEGQARANMVRELRKMED